MARGPTPTNNPANDIDPKIGSLDQGAVNSGENESEAEEGSGADTDAAANIKQRGISKAVENWQRNGRNGFAFVALMTNMFLPTGQTSNGVPWNRILALVFALALIALTTYFGPGVVAGGLVGR